MSFFNELKRRNVFRVGIAYVVMGWLLLQAADFALDLVEAPNWVIQSLFVIVALGLPVALFFAWAFELTPEGIKREQEVDREASITPRTGRKLDIAIMVSLLLIAVYFIWEARFKETSPAATPAPATVERTATPVTPTAPASPDELVLPRDTIAVLPFANRSNKEEDLFFTDGIHDDLLTQLAKIDALKVISRTSVMTYRETDKRIPEIATDLGAGIILEGGVQRAGDRVRINAQLIDVATDQHLWADTFDRELTIDNLFDIQSEISRQIVAAVKGELTDEDIRSLSDRPTDSLAAWEAYLRAREVLRQVDYDLSKYERAEPLIRQALEADPDFVEALVELVTIQLQGVWQGTSDTLAQRELARTTLERAVALAPDSAAVLAAQAEFEYRANNNYEYSLALINEAIERSPSNVDYRHHRGLCLRRIGRMEEAIEAFDNALRLDPLDSFAAATKAETLSHMNDFEPLERLLDKWLVTHPDSSDLAFWKFRLLIDRDGDLEGARELLKDRPLKRGTRLLIAHEELARLERDWNRLVDLIDAPENQAFMPIFDTTRNFRLGLTYALSGQAETARPFLERYLAEATETNRYGPIGRSTVLGNMALAHALLGNDAQAIAAAREADATMEPTNDFMFGAWVRQSTTLALAMAGERDEALLRLEERLNSPHQRGRWSLYLDPAWDFFRDDPRFNTLVRPANVEENPFRDQRLSEKS